MDISAYNSHKIKFISGVMMLLVLYVHSSYTEANDLQFASAFQRVGCNFSYTVCNPMFFFISGCLFFQGLLTITDCFPKIKKRIKTLLLPYLLWNLVFVLWYVVLSLLPVVSSFVNSNILVNFSDLWNSLKYLYINPAAFHLWFLRDLMVYVLLSPLLYIFLKKIPIVLLITLFVLGILGIIFLPSVVKVWGLFFFTFGGYIALFSSLDRVSKRITKPVFFLSLFVYLIYSFAGVFNCKMVELFMMIAAFCGIIGYWKGYDYLMSKNTFESSSIKRFFILLGSYSFFIYLFHEPAFNILKKLGIKLLGVGNWQIVVLYLLNPIIMAIVSITVALFLQRFIPRVYRLSVGGR